MSLFALECYTRVSPSHHFAYNRPIRRVTALTTIAACCLTRGCIPCLSTSSKRTGTWDPRCATRSHCHKLVSKPSDGSERGRESRGVASRKKAEHHCRVRMTHSDRCEEDCSTGGSPCATIEDGRPKRVAIESVLV